MARVEGFTVRVSMLWPDLVAEEASPAQLNASPVPISERIGP
jgi:hypothetical protein